ncbi:MAG TPA: glycosyltransferase, partial [Gammaproteobacteria bacterium]|nr:glycosyltransferase [Gammaproteobacteria bacterium]
ESGTRFKILEAGACKVPMVSTTLGAEGLDVTHLQDILIADKPDEFSNHIVKLVLDKSFAASLAQASYELVKKKYSLNMLKSQANRILEKLT